MNNTGLPSPAPDRATVERMFRGGASQREIADACDMSPRTLRKWLGRWGLTREPLTRAWPPARLARCIELYEAGWSMPRIASELGTTAVAVDSTLRTHKVPRRGQPSEQQFAVEPEASALIALPGAARATVRACGADTAARFAALMARTVSHARAKREARG